MEGEFVLLEAEPAVQAAWIHPGGVLYGVFNTAAARGNAAVHLPDGIYTDLLSERSVKVYKGKILLPESVVILRTPQAVPERRPIYSILLDYRR
jgi:hypothetical protein